MQRSNAGQTHRDRLSDGPAIVIEPRMTGLILLADPPDQAHLRLGLALDSGPVPWLWFWDRRGLGTIAMVASPRNWPTDSGTRPPGSGCPGSSPWPSCGSGSTVAAARSRWRCSISSDWRGIGNLYASEILHVARIDPQKRCAWADGPEWQQIHAAMRAGCCTKPFATKARRSPTGPTATHSIKPAITRITIACTRTGQLCPGCKDDAVRRIVQAQRATFFCPRCQSRHSTNRSRPRSGTDTGRPNGE